MYDRSFQDQLKEDFFDAEANLALLKLLGATFTTPLWLRLYLLHPEKTSLAAIEGILLKALAKRASTVNAIRLELLSKLLRNGTWLPREPFSSTFERLPGAHGLPRHALLAVHVPDPRKVPGFMALRQIR